MDQSERNLSGPAEGGRPGRGPAILSSPGRGLAGPGRGRLAGEFLFPPLGNGIFAGCSEGIEFRLPTSLFFLAGKFGALEFLDPFLGWQNNCGRSAFLARHGADQFVVPTFAKELAALPAPVIAAMVFCHCT